MDVKRQHARAVSRTSVGTQAGQEFRPECAGGRILSRIIPAARSSPSPIRNATAPMSLLSSAWAKRISATDSPAGRQDRPRRHRRRYQIHGGELRPRGAFPRVAAGVSKARRLVRANRWSRTAVRSATALIASYAVFYCRGMILLYRRASTCPGALREARRRSAKLERQSAHLPRRGRIGLAFGLPTGQRANGRAPANRTRNFSQRTARC